MPCPSSNRVDHASHVEWTNWIGDVTVRPSKLWRPTNLRELVKIASDAVAGALPEVKAVGSRYSFENIAATNHWMIDTTALDRVLRGVVDQPIMLTDYWQGQLARPNQARLVHCEAGIRLFKLCKELDDSELSLLSAGGTLAQTLAGAVSTSTHGSNPELGPLCDQVQAMHLVSQGGDEWWIERASRPLTVDDAALRQAVGGCQDLRIVRDDDLFDAAVVSAGRFGIVYSMVMMVREELRVVEYGTTMDTRAIIDRIQTGTRISRLLPPTPADVLNGVRDVDSFRYFDFIMNSRTPDQCIVRRRWETTNTTDVGIEDKDPMCEPGAAQQLAGLASLGLGGARAALGAAAALIPEPTIQAAVTIANAIVEFVDLITGNSLKRSAVKLAELANDDSLTLGRLVAEGLSDAWEAGGDLVDPIIDLISQQVFDQRVGATLTTGKRSSMWKVAAGKHDPAPHAQCFVGNSVEVFFDYRDPALQRFLHWLVDQAPRYRQAGWIAVRFSKESSALLSMHHAPQPTLMVAVEVTSLKGLPDNDRWMRRIENRAVAAGGRMHWGQQNNLTAAQVADAYAETYTNWRRQLARVVGSGQTFSNDYTRQRGLEPDPAVPQDRREPQAPASAEWRRAGPAHNVVAFTGEGRDLWCATPTAVYTKRPDTDSRWKNAGGASQVVAMALHRGQLYLTTSVGALWSRPAAREHRRWTLLGVADGCTTLAASGGVLYGTTPDNRLKARVIGTDTWRDIDSAYGVIAMDASADNLYCVTTDGSLWWRAATQERARWTRFDDATNVVGIAALDQVQNLFLATSAHQVWSRSTISRGINTAGAGVSGDLHSGMLNGHDLIGTFVRR